MIPGVLLADSMQLTVFRGIALAKETTVLKAFTNILGTPNLHSCKAY